MDKKENPRRKAAQVRKLLDQVEDGKDIVELAAGAKNLLTFEEAINNHEFAKLFAVPKRKDGRPTKYDPNWMIDAVLDAGRTGASKEKMAAVCGISKETLYKWMEEHSDFSDAVQAATDLAQVWWENFGQAATLGMIQGWNATAWIFTMKTRFPETYREVKVTEINGTQTLIDARSITINARELDEGVRDQLRAAIAAVRQLQKVSDDE